jgi:hypothetical protein
MVDRPSNNFGKRRLAPLPDPSPPVKRSRHVALLMLGTMAVGGAAYGLTPRDSCQPTSPGIAGPSSPQAAANCGPRGSSSSGGHGGNASWSRNGFYSGESTTSHPSSPGTSVASGGETARGGFGSFARSFAAHFSGGT